MEVFEASELGREGFIEDVVGEVEESEAGDEGDFRGDGAGDLVGGEGEVEEEAEVTHVGGESAGDVVAGDVEGGHVAVGIAGDSDPCAVACRDVPCRES